MTPTRFGLAVAVSLALTALLAAGSGPAWPHHRDDSARLRLSFSARPEQVEVCTVQSEEALAKLEPHMRRRVICEGYSASYLLEIHVDDALLAEDVIRGGGLRHDRPIYLLREYAVPAGQHRLRVTIHRRETIAVDSTIAATTTVEADTGLYAGRAAREVAERARKRSAAIPEILALDTVVTVAPRRVVLVTFNADQKRLELDARQ